jgi:hypothetical protein
MRPLAPLAISLLLLLTRCGSGGAAGGAANTPPVVVGEGVPDAVGPLFGGPIVVDLRAAFDDAEDPGALTLAMVALTGASIATAVVEGDAGRLVWTPLAPGLAEVVVRATDPDGRSVDDVATLTVTATVVTIDLDATADATLYPDAISANGAGDHVFVGTVAGSAPLPRRGVLRFDVGSLPSEAVVLEVMLLLEITRAPFIGPAASFAVHRLTRAFDEGTTDAEANEGTRPFRGRRSSRRRAIGRARRGRARVRRPAVAGRRAGARMDRAGQRVADAHGASLRQSHPPGTRSKATPPRPVGRPLNAGADAGRDRRSPVLVPIESSPRHAGGAPPRASRPRGRGRPGDPGRK